MASLSAFICVYNLLGYDDKNLLLFLTSPPLMVFEDFSHLLSRVFSKSIMFLILYFVNILFWFLVGVGFDWAVKKAKMTMPKQKWLSIIKVFRNLSILLLVFLCLTVFQYIRPTISQEEAIAIAKNHIDKDETVEIGTIVLSDNIVDVVSGKRYWLIGSDNIFVRINAYNGKVIKVENY